VGLRLMRVKLGLRRRFSFIVMAAFLHRHGRRQVVGGRAKPGHDTWGNCPH
jgi:hypothetical protein